MNLQNAPQDICYKTYKYMADRSIPGPTLLMSFFLIISYVTPIHIEREATFIGVFFSLLSLLIFRGTLEIGFNKIYPKIPKAWPVFYAALISLTALTWGLWCLDTVAYYGINWVSLMVLVCTAGVAAGGIIAVIPHFKLSLTFQTLILLPTGIYSFSLDSGNAYTISYLFLCYLIFMTGMGWKLYGEYWKSVENEHLLNVRAEELTAARDTAIKLAKSKSDFLATMSHEIRTPLNGILGMTQLLQESKVDNEQKENIDIILSSTKSLLRIVNDILDFSKYESGIFKAETKVIDLFELCSEIKKSFKSSLIEKNLVLDINISPQCPKHVLSDEMRIKQVLINLIGNAIKFTDNGRITLDIKALQLENSIAKLRFQITDSGIGMTEDAKATIFDSFTQADASTTRKFGGTGLGLAISKKIIDLLGGEIGVTSKPGKGSTFWFELPLKLAFTDKQAVDSTKTLAVNSQAHDFSNTSILVVEDNEVNIKYLQKVLEKSGAQVSIARDGKQAVELIKDNIFDLILMDCQMPVLDGYQATKQIRDFDNYRHTPIIAVSANSQAEEIQRCINVGMNDFIEKPFVKDTLLNKVEHYLPQSSPENKEVIKINKNTNDENLDATRIKEIKEIMEDEFENLATTFIKNTKNSLNEMQAHINSKNIQGVLAILHQLKSATKNMGATTLAENISNYEKQLKQSELEIGNINITLLQNELSCVESLLAKLD